MAEKAETAKTSGRNMDSRDVVMRKAFRELHMLDQQVDAAKEKHVTPLTNERTKVRRQLKADTQMDAATTKPLYDLYKRYIDAGEMDEDDCERVRADIREAFAALLPGSTVDWIKLLVEQGEDEALEDGD